MSRKLNFIPPIPDYDYIRRQMKADLDYRLNERVAPLTSLGKPLYERINVQIVMTQECPYSCPFCLERKNPMRGQFDADKQVDSLRSVMKEHPNARLTITGGEPSLYPQHVARLLETFYENGNGVSSGINSAGYNKDIMNLETVKNKKTRINLSVNDYVHPNLADFPGTTYQTVLTDDRMNIETIESIMDGLPDIKGFSFRFLTELTPKKYPVNIWNEIQNSPDFKISTFRIGDFFVYATFNYKDHQHGRVTLGDMYQQTHNDYKNGYSNIIIHPDGRVGINWK